MEPGGGFSDPGDKGQMNPDLVPDEDHVSGDPPTIIPGIPFERERLIQARLLLSW